MTLPCYAHELETQLPRFRDWLLAHGSAILAPTNTWEVLRFDGTECVAVIYRNQAGALKWTGGADEAFRAFFQGSAWRACRKGSRESRATGDRRRLYASLVARDGDGCLYCGREVPFEEFSKEHMLSITHGGSSHLANLAITHEGCNKKASHMSVAEKVRLVLEMRGLT